MFWPFKRKASPLLRDDWQIRAEAYTENTPDAWQLELQPRVNLFVYDDMMPGHRNHEFITGNACPMGWAITRKLYSLWKFKPMAEAFALENSYKNFMSMPGEINDIHYGYLRGEVYSIPSTQIVELDNYRQNGERYQRVRIPVVVPYHKTTENKELVARVGAGELISKKQRVVALSAFCYLGKPEYWNPRLDWGYEFAPVRPKPAQKPWERILFWTKEEANGI